MSAGLQAFFAALPILVILGLMLGLRWSAAKAGAAGLLLTIIIAAAVFDFGEQVLPDLGLAAATSGALAEAAFIAVTILWIIFPALCIHELQQSSGAMNLLRDAIGSLSTDPRIVALLIAWFFSLFMEGAAGFGTSAALAAPFLVGLGFGKVEAVTIVLIGHAIGVSFGAVGTPVLPQIAVTPYSALELSAATAIYHTLLGVLMAGALMLLVNRSVSSQLLSAAGKPLRREDMTIWAWTLAAAALFLLPYYLIATYIGPELPTLGGAMAGGTIFVALLLLRKRQTPRTESSVRPQALLSAGAPYLILVALILLTRLLPPLQQWLSSLTVQWQMSVFSGSIAFLYHPGTMLFISFIAGAWCQRILSGKRIQADIVAAMGQALRRLLPVTLALVAMLGLSRIMVHSGMIATLAETAAASTGFLWPVFAPFIGVLGTFVTGSATASNILFTEFQLSSAQRLGLSATGLLGAQGFGAAVGNIICPHNIIAASATVQLSGKEGQVLQKTSGVMFIYTLLGGLLALFVFA
jgi:lactate permease